MAAAMAAAAAAEPPHSPEIQLYWKWSAGWRWPVRLVPFQCLPAFSPFTTPTSTFALFNPHVCLTGGPDPEQPEKASSEKTVPASPTLGTHQEVWRCCFQPVAPDIWAVALRRQMNCGLVLPPDQTLLRRSSSMACWQRSKSGSALSMTGASQHCRSGWSCWIFWQRWVLVWRGRALVTSAWILSVYVLPQLPISDPYLLTYSGIRHTVGILLSHPDETRANKTVIRQLISENHTGDKKLWWTAQKCELTGFSFLWPDKWATELFAKSLEDQELRREKRMSRGVQPLSQPNRLLDQFTECPLKNWRQL